jgi:cold shock CspA family protein
MPTGRLYKFFDQRGFGFIELDGPYADEIFCHVTALPLSTKPVGLPLRVKFEIEEHEKGPRAKNVEYLDLKKRSGPARYGDAPERDGDAR